eukprot:TRINITY_DN1597_c0_g5_i4.p1 TRINITY_DN1597_c0_g5~~TRINITY_DN1597_c0_g5_i4.p1  ORF type:complete len:1031 (-),score=86.00 TRINITY_DN1597_c0_g5_i4:142-3234(-)
MGSVLVVEVEDSSVKNFTMKGIADSSLDCYIGFEYKRSEEVLSPATANSEAVTFAGKIEVTNPTHKGAKEVVFQKEGVVTVEGLVLGTDKADCRSFISDFRIERDGKELDLRNCRRVNIKCNYSKASKKAIVIADCGGSLPANAIIKIEINSDSFFKRNKELATQIHQRRALYSCSLTYVTELNFDTSRRCNEFAARFVAEGPCDAPVGSLFAFIMGGSGISITSYELMHGYGLDKQSSTQLLYYTQYGYGPPAILPKLGLRIKYGNTDGIHRGLYDCRDMNTCGSIKYVYEYPAFSSLTSVQGTLTLSVNSAITVLQPKTFMITFTAPCQESDSSYLMITPITGFAGQCESTVAGCSVKDNTIRISQSTIKERNYSFFFVMLGPTNTNNFGSPLVAQFCDASDTTTCKGIIHVSATLPSSATLKINTISPVTLTLYAEATEFRDTYTFGFALNFPVPANSKIEFTFNSAMTIASDFSCASAVKTAECTKSGSVVTLGLLAAASANEQIEVVFEGVVNPNTRGDYTGFFVRVRNKDNDLLAESASLVATIKYDLVEAQPTSQVIYSKGFEEWLFSFGFKAGDHRGTYGTQAILDITFPSHNLQCKEIQMVSTNLVRISNLRYKVSGKLAALSKFSMVCKDPAADVDLNKISFIVRDETNFYYVTGENRIVISKGTVSPSNDFLIACMHRYPTKPVRCNVTFTRKTAEPIKVMAFFGELLDPALTYSHLASGNCAIEVEGIATTCTYDQYNGIFLTFSTPRAESSFKIVGLEYINPEGSERDSNKYSARTYSVYPVIPEKIIDRCDNCLTALVDCDYPCNTCQDSLTACTSCVMEMGVGLYLMPTSFECILSFPSSHFIDSNRVLRPCIKNCKECSFREICDVCEAGFKKWNSICYSACPFGTVEATEGACTWCNAECLTCQTTSDYCTACKYSKFSYEGKCYDECIEGTGPVNFTKFRYCLACGTGCDECTHSEGQPQSTICTKCSVGYAAVEAFPPLTCASTRRLEAKIAIEKELEERDIENGEAVHKF